jgi:hypothetical protein
MRLSTKELTVLITSVDAMLNPDYDGDKIETEKITLLKKLSKELSKRGYTTTISQRYN